MSRKQRRGPFGFGQHRQDDDSVDDVVLRLSLKDVRQRRRPSKEENGSVRSERSGSIGLQQRQDDNVVDENDSCSRASYRSSRSRDQSTRSRKSRSKSVRSSRSSRRHESRSRGRQERSEGVRFQDRYSESYSDDISVTNSMSVSKSQHGEEAAIKNLITQDLWSDNADTVEKGLKKISGILGVKKSNMNARRSRDIIFKAGGHLAIVQAMRKHKDSSGVQGEGCRALGIAAEEIADSGNENAIAIVGGIDSILTAMRHYRNDEQIQDFGCGALQNLTGLDENSRILVEKEGLAVILMSMRSFPKSTLVQESACWTLVNICLQRENRPKIEKARCLSTVASAIDNHPRCPQVKVAAQEALQHLIAVVAPKHGSQD